MTDPNRHSLLEDAQGIAYGAGMAAFAITILTHLGLVTGQTAGLAVLISYATGWGFGPVFFVVNLPFYWLGYRRIGAVFVLKTFRAVGLMSGLVMLFPRWVDVAHLDPVVCAVLFGAISGSALLALFRHGASLGGVGIVGRDDNPGAQARISGMVRCLRSCGFAASAIWFPSLARFGAGSTGRPAGCSRRNWAGKAAGPRRSNRAKKGWCPTPGARSGNRAPAGKGEARPAGSATRRPGG